MTAERKTRTYHRLSIQSWEDTEGITGWTVKDNKSGIVVFRSHPTSADTTIEIIREFLDPTMEARLCSIIDRELTSNGQVFDQS